MSEVVSSSSSSSNAVEANRQNFNIDWRSKKPIFDEQMGYFYMKEEMADVEFVFKRQNKITVCQLLILSIFFLILHFQKIPAHSFALAVASEVFQKELTYGSENETTEKSSKDLQVRFQKFIIFVGIYFVKTAWIHLKGRTFVKKIHDFEKKPEHFCSLHFYFLNSSFSRARSRQQFQMRSEVRPCEGHISQKYLLFTHGTGAQAQAYLQFAPVFLVPVPFEKCSVSACNIAYIHISDLKESSAKTK